MLKNLAQFLSVLGTVEGIDLIGRFPSFEVRTRGGDIVKVNVTETTNFAALQNLDRLDRDRIPDISHDAVAKDQDSPLGLKIEKYVKPGQMIAVEGNYQVHGDRDWYDARSVHILYSHMDILLFEHTHWWNTQISAMADKWLNDLFHDKRTYQVDDFSALYHTNLNILGLPTDDNIQEMATLSRLIYGLSSAYLMSGDLRYYLAAKAGVEFQRDAFRSLSSDGRFCFWAFGRRKGKYGVKLIIPSENPDDIGSIPLYEQIYALAGLSQFYRISADWEVLHDIRRTVASFRQFYRDNEDGSYFSHIDYATFSPHSPNLGNNQARKNWNSIGDHLPAYLINLVLAIDPLPIGREEELKEFRETLLEMVATTSTLIVDKFPDPDDSVPYVNERFDTNWNPDHSWGWQQDRGVSGHNLKIAWNLTRVAHFHQARGETAPAAKVMALAEKLGTTMSKLAIDQFRSGLFDVVERSPRDGRPVEFAWYCTKDFWQQEQAILAYLILSGYTDKPEYLELAREMEAFWNLFFIDRERASVYFRVTADGQPVIEGGYGDKAGHPIAGYHSFELNYLAHSYNRAFSYRGARREDNVFCMHFKLHTNSGQRSINALPDFFAPDDLEVVGVIVNGVRRKKFDPKVFQIALAATELDPVATDIIVELCPTEARNQRNKVAAGR